MEYLFYKDLNGRRRLRRYAAAALGILTMLGGMGLLAVAQAGPEVSQPGRTHAGPIVIVRPDPTGTAGPAPTAAPCPADPDAWGFVPVFPDDNYRRIEPACVYEGLARAAAWMLLERMGYSKPAAAELLGFDMVPWTPVQVFYGYTNLKGPLDLALLSEWPAHPEFRFWQVDGEGRPALAISLRGCYRKPVDTGGVVCVVALDRSPGSAVSVLGDLAIAHHAKHLPGSRTFHLLEYAGDGLWILIGQLEGLSLEIEGVEQMESERARIAVRLGAVPWDPDWLFEAYGLTINPLPTDWRMYGLDEAALQAIGQELNRFIPTSLQVPDE
jgi:hypothetical protein